MQTYPLALNIISACWILFAVIWLLAAFATKKSVYRESRAQRLRYTIPILLGGFLLAKALRLPDRLNHPALHAFESLPGPAVPCAVAVFAVCCGRCFTPGRIG